MAKKRDAPVLAPTEAKKAKAVLTGRQALERELRRYVKRAGGFRKGLSRKDTAEAKRIMAELRREEPQWDEDIVIPGFGEPVQG